MSTLTDSMPPGSVFVPPVIVERRWKYTRFLLILSIIIVATMFFTPSEYRSTWEFITLMAIASLTWVVAFLIRMLLLDRSYVVNDPRPPWFESTKGNSTNLILIFLEWLTLAMVDVVFVVSLLQAEQIDIAKLLLAILLTVVLLGLMARFMTGISPRFRATKLAALGRIVPY